MDALSLEMAKAGLSVTAPKAAAANDVDTAAREFEAVFIAQMMEQLFADVPTDGPMGGGSGERIFRSLMIQEVGKQMAAQGGFGLSEQVKRELLALQEHKP